MESKAKKLLDEGSPAKVDYQAEAFGEVGCGKSFTYEPASCDFQQCGIFTSVDSDELVQPPIKLRNSK